MKMKVLDLFSGIGGFSLGLHRTGKFETVAFCEIEPFAQKVLMKNFPGVMIFNDVKKLSYLQGQIEYNFHGHDYVEIDVICGGFPCQDISVAGKQRGLINESGEATRSGLWFEFKRLIQEIKPKYVIIENVANLRSNGLATVIKDLWQIGYECEWHVISARAVGACHLRERIWILAYPRCERPQGWGGSGRIQSELSRAHGKNDFVTNTNHLRLWKSFTTEEEKSQWWAKTTFSFRNWWEIEPTICRVDDGLSGRLDKNRARRIKALGNTIVPQIAELIGNALVEHEEMRELLS